VTQTQPVLAGCVEFGPGQASAADNTLCDAAVPEADAASLTEHGAIYHSHGTQHSSRLPEKPYGTTSNRDGSICLDIEEWDRRYPFSPKALRRRSQAKRAAESARNAAESDQSQSILDPVCRPQGPRQTTSSHRCLQQTSDSCFLFPHHSDRDQTSNPAYRHPIPDDRGEQSGVCPAAPPQVVESQAPIPTLPGDGSTSELEPADAEPRPQLQSPSGTVPGRGSGSCSLSQHTDHHDDDLASDPDRQCLRQDGQLARPLVFLH
jgi:hypothetical protein